MIEISVMKESKQIHATNNVTFLTSFTRKKNSCPVKIPTLFVKGVNPFLVILAFAGGKRYIYTKQLGYCNRIRTHNHLVRKRTLNHLTKLVNLAKWLSLRLRTKWFWARITVLSLKEQHVHVKLNLVP